MTHARTTLRHLLATDGWVALDTETTGLGDHDQIMEVAVVAPSQEVLFSSLVRPTTAIDPAATAVNKINLEALEAAPTWPEVWPAVSAALRGKTVVAYVADFDRRMLQQTCAAFGLAAPVLPWLCAHELCRDIWGLSAPTHLRLATACRALGLPAGNHRAADDCRAMIEVLRRLAAGAIPPRVDARARERRL